MPVPRGRIVANSSFWSPESAGLTPRAKDLLYELTELDRNIYEAVWLKSNSPSRAYVEINKKYTLESGCSSADIDKTRSYYLGLLQQCLTGSIYGDASFAPFGSRTFDQRLREHGLDWPERAQTMVGDKRLANLRELISIVLDENVPGDLIETGVWRGGSCILMRAVLMSYGITDRKVWVADSFEGLPKGDESLYPADRDSDFHSYAQLAISLEDVRNNFLKYGLLDDQVVFLKGWFKDTLPTAPINSLALIRLDGDMYESTMDGLVNLYPKLSVGGYVIVDDYHVVPACKLAVHDYFIKSGISPELVEIDGVGVYWKKISPLPLRTTGSSLKENIPDIELGDRLSDALARINRIIISELHVSMVKRDVYLAKLENRNLNLGQQLAKREASLLNLSKQLEESIEIISKIYESYSWTVTAPLRRLSALFRKLRIVR
ncbi:hypothetical protein DMO17_07945 [Aquipseudomonas alcaligenes]|uniref:Macrocin O-methyltransferase n=2 Tax=Aquipseudomonas alcaligenes TaxID=43263 RepID=A0A2V4M7A3_AQUAC|nr:hypothetical protein DMO17_07945 [Pseudomonas alcaligenes]